MFILLSLVFATLSPSSAHAFEIPGFELVYTAPVETTLQAEDLRGPVTVWTEMIDNAKKEICLEHFYVSGKDGEPIDTIIASLEKAAARGVKIRFLIEEKSLKGASMPATVEKIKAIKGIQFRTIDWSKMMGDGIIHAKFMIVDGKIGFLGSQNFDWRALKHIHETGVRVSDAKIAGQMQAIFDNDWKAADLIAKGKKVPVLNKKNVFGDSGAKAFLLASPNAYNPKGVGNSEQTLPVLIALAKNEIRIQLLDYYPLNRDKTYYNVFDNALRAAQARKVKIKLMVSHWNQEKPGIDHLKSLSMLPGVEIKIVNLPKAKEGFIPFARVNHSKIMTIDGETAWVGTSNWTGGYMDKSRNLELVINNREFAERIAQLHEQMWSSDYAAKLDISKDYPRPAKGEENPKPKADH